MEEAEIFRRQEEGEILEEFLNEEELKTLKSKYKLGPIPFKVGFEFECLTTLNPDELEIILLANNLKGFIVSTDNSIKYDAPGTIENWNQDKEVYHTEIVSFPGVTVKDIRNFGNLIKGPEFQVNTSTGLHIHVDISSWDEETLKRMYKLILLIQDQLYDLVPDHRVNSLYCAPIIKDKTISDRYTCVNFMSSVLHPFTDKMGGTLEWRLWSATRNPYILLRTIQLCCRVHEYVENKENVIEEGITLLEVLRHPILINYIQRRRRWLIIEGDTDKRSVNNFTKKVMLLDGTIKTVKDSVVLTKDTSREILKTVISFKRKKID